MARVSTLSLEELAQLAHDLNEVRSELHEQNAELRANEDKYRRLIEDLEGGIQVIRRVTQRKAHEREIERLNRLYAAISELNQIVVRVQSREELFRHVGGECRGEAALRRQIQGPVTGI